MGEAYQQNGFLGWLRLTAMIMPIVVPLTAFGILLDRRVTAIESNRFTDEDARDYVRVEQLDDLREDLREFRAEVRDELRALRAEVTARQ